MTDEDIRIRDGRLLAAAQRVDLFSGSCDNRTREYWYARGDDARATLADLDSRRYWSPYANRWVTEGSV